MNAGRSRARGSRSTSRSVLIGAGGQETAPSSVMSGNYRTSAEQVPQMTQPRHPDGEAVKRPASGLPATAIGLLDIGFPCGLLGEPVGQLVQRRRVAAVCGLSIGRLGVGLSPGPTREPPG
jgi:hypothetical protein